MPPWWLGIMACGPVNEPGDPFAPVPIARPLPAEPAPRGGDAPDSEPASEPGKATEAPEPGKDPVALQGLLLGIRPDDAPPRADTESERVVVVVSEDQAPAPEPPSVPVVPVATSLAVDPTAEPPWLGDWGIRLISTTVSASPPRAMVGLPDGTELVVKAGTLLPEVGVVVLAVGTGRIQIAEIEPAGDHARVRTKTVTALYAPAPGE